MSIESMQIKDKKEKKSFDDYGILSNTSKYQRGSLATDKNTSQSNNNYLDDILGEQSNSQDLSTNFDKPLETLFKNIPLTLPKSISDHNGSSNFERKYEEFENPSQENSNQSVIKSLDINKIYQYDEAVSNKSFPPWHQTIFPANSSTILTNESINIEDENLLKNKQLNMNGNRHFLDCIDGTNLNNNSISSDMFKNICSKNLQYSNEVEISDSNLDANKDMNGAESLLQSIELSQKRMNIPGNGSNSFSTYEYTSSSNAVYSPNNNNPIDTTFVNSQFDKNVPHCHINNDSKDLKHPDGTSSSNIDENLKLLEKIYNLFGINENEESSSINIEDDFISNEQTGVNSSTILSSNGNLVDSANAPFYNLDNIDNLFIKSSVPRVNGENNLNNISNIKNTGANITNTTDIRSLSVDSAISVNNNQMQTKMNKEESKQSFNSESFSNSNLDQFDIFLKNLLVSNQSTQCENGNSNSNEMNEKVNPRINKAAEKKRINPYENVGSSNPVNNSESSIENAFPINDEQLCNQIKAMSNLTASLLNENKNDNINKTAVFNNSNSQIINQYMISNDVNSKIVKKDNSNTSNNFNFSEVNNIGNSTNLTNHGNVMRNISPIPTKMDTNSWQTSLINKKITDSNNDQTSVYPKNTNKNDNISIDSINNKVQDKQLLNEIDSILLEIENEKKSASKDDSKSSIDQVLNWLENDVIPSSNDVMKNQASALTDLEKKNNSNSPNPSMKGDQQINLINGHLVNEFNNNKIMNDNNPLKNLFDQLDPDFGTDQCLQNLNIISNADQNIQNGFMQLDSNEENDIKLLIEACIRDSKTTINDNNLIQNNNFNQNFINLDQGHNIQDNSQFQNYGLNQPSFGISQNQNFSVQNDLKLNDSLFGTNFLNIPSQSMDQDLGQYQDPHNFGIASSSSVNSLPFYQNTSTDSSNLMNSIDMKNEQNQISMLLNSANGSNPVENQNSNFYESLLSQIESCNKNSSVTIGDIGNQVFKQQINNKIGMQYEIMQSEKNDPPSSVVTQQIIEYFNQLNKNSYMALDRNFLESIKSDNNDIKTGHSMMEKIKKDENKLNHSAPLIRKNNSTKNFPKKIRPAVDPNDCMPQKEYEKEMASIIRDQYKLMLSVQNNMGNANLNYVQNKHVPVNNLINNYQQVLNQNFGSSTPSKPNSSISNLQSDSFPNQIVQTSENKTAIQSSINPMVRDVAAFGRLNNQIKPTANSTDNQLPRSLLNTQLLLQRTQTPNHYQFAWKNREFQKSRYSKPVFSYSCLISLALIHSQTGSLPVNEIYKYMTDKFPYFKTAPDGWKNSVRHNLSLNKAFQKTINLDENSNSQQRKGCLWSLRPDRIRFVEKEIAKWIRKHEDAIKNCLNKSSDFEEIFGDIMRRNTSDSPEHALSHAFDI